ncbi:hypothetical protein [Ferruginivarius sediminum]|uniref:Uncharacterized protein n=1 Tax=Ferruginivarius sediminum TaxID=2661937 RepID=A0A369T8E2_9PROT|nr:hypothetical protein [Ferruginivarius sediminum]RDD61162.1 hypothetical protein DRB17_14820 [Ferruginivarius sediminum]
MTSSFPDFDAIHVANDRGAPSSIMPAVSQPKADERAPWFDPGWLIRRALAAGPGEPAARAEDALLAWLVRLPVECDPADAADKALDAYDRRDGTFGRGARRLLALLEETRYYTRQRLTRVRRVRRRHRERDDA